MPTFLKSSNSDDHANRDPEDEWFASIYEPESAVFKAAVRMAGNVEKALDLLQETTLRIIAKKHRVSDKDNPEGFFYRS